MHKKILKDASLEQMSEIVDYAIEKIKLENEELYNELEMKFYKMVYGCHFNQWLLDKATSKLINEDGTRGAHWTLEQTSSVARQNGIPFDKFNEYDWNYVMNMVYSDYYGAIPNETSSYVKVAKKFLEDKDGKTGKAFCYFMSMLND